MAQLGNAQQVQYTQWAAQGAGAGVTAATTAGWLTAGAATGIGLAVAGVALALTALFSRKGPEQRRITTEIVNELEPLLKANLEGYRAGPRTRASQAAALANFDSAWAYLSSEQACGNPAMGNPGRACIADRQRGGRWDWFAYYRDPIAQDPEVLENSAGNAVRQVLPGLAAEDSDSLGRWLPGAALILLGVLL